jgi:serine/threonine-protein kinase HipA
MAEETLIVYLHGRPAGRLHQDAHGLVTFDYLEAWRRAPGAHRLSLCMPLAKGPFEKRRSEAWFLGGLPDDAETREQIAEAFDLTPHKLFQLLKAVGREFPGAVTIVPEGEDPPVEAKAPSAFLDEVALAAELRALRRQPLLAAPEKLRLSLAGAQSKTALYVAQDGRLALPRDVPSTHIIKPELDDRFPALILIETYCLELARRMGLDVPPVSYATAQGIPYLLIERYDRVREEDGSIRRLHQEDFCQALGVRPDKKYEREGGPGHVRCFLEVIDELDAPAADRLRMLDAVIFNYLVGNTDAHAKNFSILYTPEGMRLAPLYDLVSTFTYREDESLNMETRLAMNVGGEGEIDRIQLRHWKRFAEQCRLAWPAVRDRLETMSREIQSRAIEVENELSAKDITDQVFHRAVQLILRNARHIRQRLQFERVPDDALPGRQLVARFHESLRVGTDARLQEPLDQRYRRFMTQLATRHRRARLAGDAETDRALGALGRALTDAFNAWRDGPDLSAEQRALLDEHLGEVP